MESTFGRFWKYTDTRINLTPIDIEEPRLGGRVDATEWKLDVRTLSVSKTNYHGVYGEDFLTFAEFDKDVDVKQDENLIQAVEGGEGVLDRHSFRFENGKVLYSRQVSEVKDLEVEHEIDESELTETIPQTWSESLFYGVGNKAM